MVSIVTGLAIVGAPFEARAWSRDGHRVTALVAEALLTPIARHNLQAILGAEDLASASVWADDIRSGGHGRADRPETASWHFVDMPLDADRFEPTADYCRRGCVPSKIDALVDEIRSELDESTHRRRPLSSAERRRLRDAVAFLVHFVADAHQPLHCADRDDGGGNGVLVTWVGEPRRAFGDAWTLHALWDDALVTFAIRRSGRRNVSGFAELLAERLTPSERASASADPRSATSTSAWVESSHALARSVSYALPSERVLASTRGVTKRDDRGHRLSFVVVNDPYLERATPVAARQLQLAGIRLARLLNDAFDRELRL